MELTALRLLVLLCILIIPLRGPSKRRRGGFRRPNDIIVSSKYGINENGELEEKIKPINKDLL